MVPKLPNIHNGGIPLVPKLARIERRASAEPGWLAGFVARQVGAVGRRAAGWTWTKVSVVHGAQVEDRVPCNGDLRSYRYRIYASTDRAYTRCIGLTWCSACREYSGTMVYVARGVNLMNRLAGLPALEREKLLRSEVKLLDYLDRLARRGSWPTGR
ncbi:hypothetical protein Ate02nite_51630 [Paractinoplanes tereljensis]|uniref:Uncharacterized protein n=1 Tax=Paractinoplanes tereljensis TaxID=571912 RepID=A0A919NPS2_9ACTN|nr:hypothetical protein Ate02nite_51630 [Actinoplanes tereljensis]